MAYTDNTGLRNLDFENIFKQEFQQTKSVLRSLIGNRRFMNQYSQAWPIVNAVTSGTPLTSGAHADTIYLPHSSEVRGLKLAAETRADIIDQQELLASVADPTSQYMLADLAYYERRCDTAIINAFDGTAYTGQTLDGTQSYDTSMDVYVDTSSTLYSGILNVKSKFNGKSVPRSNRYLIIGEDTETNVFQMDEFINADYNQSRPIYDVDSEILGRMVGFTIIGMPQEMLGTTTVSGVVYNKCFAFQADSMAFGQGTGELGFAAYQARNPNKNFETVFQTFWNISAGRWREEGVSRLLVKKG